MPWQDVDCLRTAPERNDGIKQKLMAFARQKRLVSQAAFMVCENGTGLEFHFGKEEGSFKSGQDMKHPCLSSILYLTGSDEDRLRLGKAHSCGIRNDASKGHSVHRHPGPEIRPRKGRYRSGIAC